jgi:hypothetical protein
MRSPDLLDDGESVIDVGRVHPGMGHRADDTWAESAHQTAALARGRRSCGG